MFVCLSVHCRSAQKKKFTLDTFFRQQVIGCHRCDSILLSGEGRNSSVALFLKRDGSKDDHVASQLKKQKATYEDPFLSVGSRGRGGRTVFAEG